MTEEGHIARLRAELLRGGRLVKVKGILASAAPSFGGVCMAAVAALSAGSLGFAANALADTTISVAGQPDQVQDSGVVSVVDHSSAGLNAPAGPSPGNQGVWVRDNGATGVTGVTIDVDKVQADNAGLHVGQYNGTGSITITNQSVISDSDSAIWIDPVAASAGDITLNLGDVQAQNQGIHLSAGNTGDQTINISGSVSAQTDSAIFIGGATQGALTIDQAPTGTITSGTRVAPTDLFRSGGGDGIRLEGTVGAAGSPQPTTITTGDLDVTGTGVNLGTVINRVDGETNVTTGNITGNGMGVVIESNDNGDNYAINVRTGTVTTGGTGIAVNQSGTGSISVETGDINAGMRTAGGVNGFQNGGGYGVRLDSDPHGTTVAGSGGADWILKTGNITVTDRATGDLAGTGIGLGTIQNGGNGNTTVTAGDIQAGTGVVFNRNGTGAVSLTTGDITATTGNGIQYGTNIVKNDLVIKTGDITAAGAGITGDTYVGAGVTTIDVGNITAGGDGIDVIHSGTGAATINAGNVTSTGGRGIALNDDAAAFNPDETIGGVEVTVNNVDAQGNAIDVIARVKQTPTVITANGTVTSTNGQGIALTQSNTGTGAGNVTVTANDTVTAFSTAINVSTSGLGDTTVQANGAVTGTNGYGVFVSKSGDGNASIDTKAAVTGRTGISLATNGDGNGTIHAEDLVSATAGSAIQVTGFGNGDLSIAADKGVTATGNGIDLGGSANSGANMGSVSITAGGPINAGGIGINGDTGPNTAATTISVGDITSGSTGINWINSGTQPMQLTSTGTIKSDGVGISLTTDAFGQNASPDSQTVISVNHIDTPNNTAIAVNSNAAKGTVITTNGAINTPAASVIAGDGMRVTEHQGPLIVNIAQGSAITSFNNTMELTNNGTAGTTVNVDGTLKETAQVGGSDGVIWVWDTPGTTTVNINDGSTVQAADSNGFVITDHGGSSVVKVDNAAVTGGFRMGGGNDALTFNSTNMANVGTLNGGGGSTGGDVLTLNTIQNFTRNLQIAGQEIQNWDAVNLNGGTADLSGTMTTGAFTLGIDGAGNPAALAMGANHVGDTLTVTGDYIGAGGGITLDTDASTHASDKLVVGGSVSGVTGLSLNNLTPGGALSDLQDIAVVDVTGTSPGSAFVLANGPALLGGRAYQLQQGDSLGANPLDWFLALQPCPAGGLNDTNGVSLGCQTDDKLTMEGTESVTGNLEGAGGMDQLTVQGDASVSGIVAGGNVGADSSASLDAADLIVINTTGSVGGVQGNLGDDMIFVVGSSTVAGDVAGNEGSNQIRIGGVGALPDDSVPATDAVTVNGNVLGGDSAATDGNNQIWVLGGSHVLGNVIGGNGNDTIVLNGATARVDGAIDGGDGNDTFALMRGTVASVSGGAGNENISLDGATVSGAINGGAGDDTINLIRGTVAGGVDAGAGADTVNVEGSTFTLGSTKLDGGAAGQGNTLNLRNVDQTLTTPQNNLVNWDTVNVDSSTVTVSGGDSLTAAQVNLINSVIVARDGFTINGNLSLDPSTIDMQDGAVGDTFNVSGNYDAIGAGNTLRIDADFAADQADELHVGGTITGVTDLNVRDVTSAAGAVTGQDVLVAQAGGNADASNFRLVGGPIAKGIWDYDLANGVAANSVVLRGSLNSVAALYSATAGALADAFGGLPTLEERVGQRQWLVRNNDSVFEGIWLRLAGERMTKTPRTSSVDFTTLNRAWEVQVGADFALLGNEDGLLTAGVTGQYKGMDAEVGRPASDDDGEIRAHGGGGGVNLTWNGARGGYVDLQAQYNEASATLGTKRLGDTVKDLDVDSTSAGLEAGKRFVISADRKSALVPQAQVSWNRLSSDSFTDRKGVEVDLGTYESSVARLGLAYEFHPNGVNLVGPDKTGQMFYAIANVLRNLSPRNSSDAQDKELITRDERTWGEIGLGGSYALTSNALLYGQATYSQSFDNADDNHGIGGTVGLRWSFGEAIPPPPPAPILSAAPKDSDGDGVLDDLDRCQGTPAGRRVDAVGCPLPMAPVQAPPVVTPAPAAAPERIELKGVGFQVNSNKLTGDSRRILDDAVAALLPVLQKSRVAMVEVGGHTDSSGKPEKNVRLSQARADAVREYLVLRGLDASQVKAVGYGSSQPIASNDTPAGRASNRRVELKLIRK